MTLDEYLIETRCLLPNRPGPDYDSYIEAIRSFFPELIESVVFKSVYSIQRSCEVVDLGGTTHIVYDQAFGQYLDILNRIYLHSTRPMDAYIYAHKIVAQLLQQRGRLDLAAPIGKAYEAYVTAERPDVGQDAGSTWYTWIQEHFVILHELVHLQVRRQSDDEREHTWRRRVRGLARRIVQEIDEGRTLERNWEQIARDAYEALRGVAAAGGVSMGLDTQAAILEGLRANKENVLRVLAERQDILEEIHADIEATRFLRRLVIHLYGAPYLISMPVYVGLYNLRFRAACRQAVDGLLRPTGWIHDYVTAASVRLLIWPALKLAAEASAGHDDHVISLNREFWEAEHEYLVKILHVCQFGLLRRLHLHTMVYRGMFLECARMSDQAKSEFIDSLW